jgi:hypothetical protein
MPVPVNTCVPFARFTTDGVGRRRRLDVVALDAQARGEHRRPARRRAPIRQHPVDARVAVALPSPRLERVKLTEVICDP